MRVAFVSPLPPAPTGIADYTRRRDRRARRPLRDRRVPRQDEVDAGRLPGVPVAPGRRRSRSGTARGRTTSSSTRWATATRTRSCTTCCRACRACWSCTTSCCTTRARATFLDAPAVRAYAADPRTTRRSATRRGSRSTPTAPSWRTPIPAQADRLARGAARHRRRPAALRVPAVPPARRGVARGRRAQRLHGGRGAGGGAGRRRVRGRDADRGDGRRARACAGAARAARPAPATRSSSARSAC